jgi:Peptidase family M23
LSSHRTTARGLLFLLVLGVFTGTANAAEVPRVTAFPVVGNVNFINDWHDPRPGGWHEGNDIMSTRHQPAVAFEKGRVEKWSGGGCMLVLHGASGMDYWYIHLNNDLGARNDNDGGCRNGVSYAPGLQQNEFVRRGELIGYVGDSGDANGIQPHLHFEIHKPSGQRINPYRYLLEAKHLLYPRPDGADEVWLAFWRSKVVAVGDDTVTIRTRTITLEPRGWRYPYSRRVTFGVPPEVVVKRQTAAGTQDASLNQNAEGQRARVWSVPFGPSWTTQRAAAGTLSIKRVYLLG